MDKLLPCPFCGSKETELYDVQNYASGDEYSVSSQYISCRCDTCGARSGKVAYDFFNRFSKHTVEEFRRNNLLRAREDERYEQYVNERKALSVQKWNTRSRP